MKLFHSPGSCSVGIRVILNELGIDYDLHIVDLLKGEQYEPAYQALNPKRKVPALLRDDGSLLTEFPAIAYWLARNFPDAGLIPDHLDGQARALELLDFIVSTLHMRGTALIMRPAAFATSPQAREEVVEVGRRTLDAGLAQLAHELGSKRFLMGDRFTIPDAAAFYLLSWVQRLAVGRSGALDEYFRRVSQRPAVIAATDS